MNENSPEYRASLISFQQLRLFESVGRLRSLRKASDECNLSQPAVTQALAKLETHVGLQLLNRRANGSYLNESGVIFHRRIANFVRSIELALVELGVPGGIAAAPNFARRLSRTKIRNLLAVMSSASITQAAEELAVSTASLQRAAHELERDLQRPLFHRTSDGLMATQAGSQFGRAVRLAMQEVEWGITEVEAALGSFSSRIAIGALPSGGSILFSSVLEEFIAAYPGVEMRIISENAEAMMQSLSDGRVDFVIGLLAPTPPSHLVVEPIAATPFVIAVRRGHDLLYRKALSFSDLVEYDWVIGLPGSSRRSCFEAMFEKRDRPAARIMSSTLGLTRKLLEQSSRLTLMTTYELEQESDALVALTFPVFMPVPNIGITMRANWRKTSLHEHFIELLRHKIKNISGTIAARRLAS